MKKNNKFNRRKILIGATTLTTAGLLISCKENISIYEPLDKLISLLNV